MNLIIDIGNTRAKIALFEGRELVRMSYANSIPDLIAALPNWLQGVTHCIVGTVVDEISDLLKILPATTLLFKSDTPIPVKNAYATQHTLGSDRLAAAIGAQAIFPGRNCLVIDAGTCIKYNIVTATGEYLGGAISPGMPMRLRAMHDYTDRLPLLAFDDTFDGLTGRSSKDSILAGALTGAVAEAEGMATRYAAQYEDLITVITGGDGPYLAKRLKNHIFAEPFLILKGLNEVLIYNRELEK